MITKTKAIWFIVLSLILLFNTVAVVCIADTRPTMAEVKALIEPESKIYEMLNAKVDCEKVISRTQECILYFEYLTVEK